MCARCDIVAQLWKCATSSRYPASLSNTERPAKPCRSACRLARSEPGVALSTTVENGARPKHVLAFQLKTLIRLVSPSPHLFVTYRPSLFTLDRSYVTCRQPRRARSPRFYLNAVVQPLLVLSCFFFLWGSKQRVRHATARDYKASCWICSSKPGNSLPLVHLAPRGGAGSHWTFLSPHFSYGALWDAQSARQP